MTEPAALLAALQLADSALPIGRFVHSSGLESWLNAHRAVTSSQLAELVEAVVSEAIAPLDGAVLAHAHRAATIDSLLALDKCLTARKLTPPTRIASQAPGRQLAGLAPQLAPADALLAQFAHHVRAQRTEGNLAVVEGTLARALGMPERDIVLVELRAAASALLSAAVRLGALAPTPAQVLLSQLAPALAAAAEDACSRTLDNLSSTTPELELYALIHSRAHTRLFST